MDITPIKTQRDYRRALKEIEGLMTAKRDTPEGDRLDVLVTLVEAWEAKHYPIDLPDPVEAPAFFVSPVLFAMYSASWDLVIDFAIESSYDCREIK